MGRCFLQIQMLDSPLHRKMLIRLDVSHHVLVLYLLYFTSLLYYYLYTDSFGVLFFLAAEGFTRGRSYNIRIDDQVLLRFSPKNSDSTYYFGDMVLKFVLLHLLCVAVRIVCLSSFIADWWSAFLFSWNWKAEVPWGKRLSNVCKFVWLGHSNYNQLIFSQVSITLETSETINPRALHPSRRGSPTITKVPFYSFRIWFDFEPNLHDTASFCALYLNVLLEKNGGKNACEAHQEVTLEKHNCHYAWISAYQLSIVLVLYVLASIETFINFI